MRDMDNSQVTMGLKWVNDSGVERRTGGVTGYPEFVSTVYP
jgi:hypothetical protein